MIVADLEAVIMFEPERLMNLKVKTDGGHFLFIG
jgi:hypothetical protein